MAAQHGPLPYRHRRDRWCPREKVPALDRSQALLYDVELRRLQQIFVPWAQLLLDLPLRRANAAAHRRMSGHEECESPVVDLRLKRDALQEVDKGCRVVARLVEILNTKPVRFGLRATRKFLQDERCAGVCHSFL